MIASITHNTKYFFVITSTNARKSLTYQLILKVTEDIILVISLMIALIEDKTQ